MVILHLSAPGGAFAQIRPRRSGPTEGDRDPREYGGCGQWLIQDGARELFCERGFEALG